MGWNFFVHEQKKLLSRPRNQDLLRGLQDPESPQSYPNFKGFAIDFFSCFLTDWTFDTI